MNSMKTNVTADKRKNEDVTSKLVTKKRKISTEDCFIQKDLCGSHRILSLDVSHLNEKMLFVPENLEIELNKMIKEMKNNVKIQFCVDVEFINKKEEIKTQIFSNSSEEMSSSFIKNGIDRINEKIERMTQLGSDWKVSKILEVSFVCAQFENICRLSGKRYIETPESLKKKHAIVNVKNVDDLCFLYSILAITQAEHIQHHRERVSNYYPYIDTLKYDQTKMPMKLVDIPQFEKDNGIAINVLSYKEEKNIDVLELKHPYINIIHRTKVKDVKPIYLLLLENQSTFHYVAVLHLNRLLNVDVKDISNVRIQSLWCEYCLNGFKNDAALQKHVAICQLNLNGTTLFSIPKDTQLEFKDWSKTVSPPFVLYADFEAILPKDDKHFQKHIPISAGALLINNFTGEYEYQSFVGESCVLDFLQYLEVVAKDKVLPYYKEEGEKPMKRLTSSQLVNFAQSKDCYLCKKETPNLVKDHDHWTGDYLGAACQKCNLSRKIRKTLPILFHNLKGYDMHHILKHGLSNFKNWNLSCIPTSTEKFISLIVHTMGIQIKFIDSYQFLNDSLSKAVNTLTDTPITKTEMKNDKLCKSKGIFPYEFATSLNVLTETLELPPIWEGVIESEYMLAKDIWKETECHSMLDYMLVYMKLDVFLLADVFQQFRQKSIQNNGLEPLNFYGIPGMSWASALMTLDEPITLLNDLDMYNFFDSGIRGGMTFVNKHHVVASQETQLLYIDINNLYGWALKEMLPYKDFEWAKEEELDQLLEQCRNTDISLLNFGCTFEVDIEIPENVHDFLNDLPLAPEKKCPPNSKVEKLLLTHLKKHHYVVHWRLLKLYMELGAMVTKVHRVVKFGQGHIFQKYVDTNTELRSTSSNDLDKNYYKLLNNSLYGKCVENLKKRINLRLCTTAAKLVKYTSKPTFRRSIKIDNDLIAILLNKENIVLDRPSYIGQTVLDLSKLRMYDLQYRDLKKYREEFQCQINIVAGDTDSFFLECKKVDVQKQLLPAMIRDQLLDTSNYPKEHTLHSKKLKSVVGKFKDESEGKKKYREWIFLRPKCYMLQTEENYQMMEEKEGVHQTTKDDLKSMKAKGISLLGSSINFKSYMDAYLNDSVVSIPQKRFGTNNHQIFTTLTTKVALSSTDDKRKWIGKNQSVAYGHYLDDSIFPPQKAFEPAIIYPMNVVDADADVDDIVQIENDIM